MHCFETRGEETNPLQAECLIDRIHIILSQIAKQQEKQKEIQWTQVG